jgi:uncharacterized protein (TIGR02001 family)
MKFPKTLVAAALLTTAGVAQAELSANIGAHSKYIFRGVELSDGAAVSGGLDYDSGAGFYAGTWMSDIAGAGTELDLYAGFAGEAGSIGYDINALYFAYPNDSSDLDYLELTLGLSMGALSAQISYTPWEKRDSDVDSSYGEGDFYFAVGADLPMEVDGITFSALIGYYDFDDDGSSQLAPADELSYTHWNLTASKDVGELGTFSLAYDQTDGDSDNGVTHGAALFTVGWTKDF